MLALVQDRFRHPSRHRRAILPVDQVSHPGYAGPYPRDSAAIATTDTDSQNSLQTTSTA